MQTVNWISNTGINWNSNTTMYQCTPVLSESISKTRMMTYDIDHNWVSPPSRVKMCLYDTYVVLCTVLGVGVNSQESRYTRKIEKGGTCVCNDGTCSPRLPPHPKLVASTAAPSTDNVRICLSFSASHDRDSDNDKKDCDTIVLDRNGSSRRWSTRISCLFRKCRLCFIFGNNGILIVVVSRDCIQCC